MLSSDLVRARRRGDQLVLTEIKGTERPEIESIASQIIDTIEASEGQTLDEISEALSAVARSPRHEKVWAGLKKLALDDCQFGTPLEVDAPSLRTDLFTAACRARRAATAEAPFSREQVLREVAARVRATCEEVEDGLFSDLKGASRLTRPTRLSKELLVEAFELAQIQGILLRAVSLRVTVECSSPDQARELFHKLKFRRLLFRLNETNPGVYEIQIEGPFSLFESVTKYGLQLALLVPILQRCLRAELSAELLWGKERRRLTFQTTFVGNEEVGAAPLRSEVSSIMSALEKAKSPFHAEPAREFFNIPGVGLCVPDLKLSAAGRDDVYVEVLGFWSREAVWKRVEWAEAGAPVKVVFAVSSRLRVSQEVLPQETGAALYVYKGQMSAPALLRQVEELSRSF